MQVFSPIELDFGIRNGHTLEVVIELSQHGARSSMAERLTVDLEVAGSIPVGHPRKNAQSWALFST